MDALVFGINAVREAIQDPSRIQKVFIENGLKSPATQKLKDEVMRAGISYSFVPEQKLHKLTKENHQGFVALLGEIQFASLEDIIDNSQQQLFILLDGVTDVRNFGAIIRSAMGLGASGIIIGQTGAAPLNDIAIQASAGGAFHIPIIRVAHLKDAIFLLQAHGIPLMGCTEKTDTLIGDINLKRSMAIVMGNENKGISKGVLNLCDEHIKIPINDTLDSYNVSVATAIVLYEYHRQNS
ncbi:MAG: 23S rRNA (guanosine(2251)-2'-O)-methyltransferase RlmB [Bacteroidetes bacterium]|nr:23S rRNA (guanosine(2251)-2'-O)-methyltransferase RlmB [Bacteroidota bacterium]MDA1084611.1 23S rRNA (guanosine(2251)-2'-O)-methyltransferase RlmB [Bacteroidota bacterium]